jgi:hypothetical protein
VAGTGIVNWHSLYPRVQSSSIVERCPRVLQLDCSDKHMIFLCDELSRKSPYYTGKSSRISERLNEHLYSNILTLRVSNQESCLLYPKKDTQLRRWLVQTERSSSTRCLYGSLSTLHTSSPPVRRTNARRGMSPPRGAGHTQLEFIHADVYLYPDCTLGRLPPFPLPFSLSSYPPSYYSHPFVDDQEHRVNLDVAQNKELTIHERKR